MYVRMYVCTYVCMYVCMYVCRLSSHPTYLSRCNMSLYNPSSLIPTYLPTYLPTQAIFTLSVAAGSMSSAGFATATQDLASKYIGM